MPDFAVWSLHSPAVEMVAGGYTIDGSTVIPLGAPIHEPFPTKEEAEAWRLGKLEEVRHGNPA